jgi:nucleoside-diphosphate-sugar epimerase
MNNPSTQHPPKKIVLPGGAGLVGQNLIVHLKRAGYGNLVVLDKHCANVAILRRLHPDIVAQCVDLAESGGWEAHFEGADIVVMLQAQIGHPHAGPFVRNNITATKRILASIRQHKVPFTIHVSSSVVESVADDHYTNTKRDQEKLVLASGLPIVVLRPTLMFGWFDRKHLGWLARFMKRTPVFPIPGHGRYSRQPLYVGDFCRIILSCIQNRPDALIYNISGRERIDYIEIIRTIKQTTAAKSLLVKVPIKVFSVLLKTWALFDRNPPFTADQLRALVADDEFEVIDWPAIFGVSPTSFAIAIRETFTDSTYANVVLEF